MSSWVWIDRKTVLALHDVQLARYGGLDGIRDGNALDAALARPAQLDAYGEPPPDAAALAAAYGHGLARSHAFSDANKRTAWIVTRLFLKRNGHELAVDPHDAVETMVQVAQGTMSQEAFADWLRARLHSDPAA